jgi:hypothetical protein
VVYLDRVFRRSWTVLHTYAALALVAHGVAGSFGWFGRYEVYLYAALAPVLVRFIATGWRVARMARVVTVVAVVAGVIAVYPLVQVTARTPAATRDIWSQQGQTAAFVREEWGRPVAVNDIGLTSYEGGEPVLDLWGLSNEQARKDRFENDGSAWADRLVRGSGVRLVAVYSDWFRPIPRTWTLVGEISGAPIVTSAERKVDLYVVDPVDAPMVCGMLEDFDARTTSAWTRAWCVDGEADSKLS